MSDFVKLFVINGDYNKLHHFIKKNYFAPVYKNSNLKYQFLYPFLEIIETPGNNVNVQ